jgi:ABC-type antimicrobial peptide transport system permease subunit
MYPIKHVFRNWKLFTALLIGVTLAATFLAGISVKADVAGEQALNAQLKSVRTDITINTVSLNLTNAQSAVDDIAGISGVKSVAMMARYYLPINITNTNDTCRVQMTSFPKTSRIYDEWLNKPQNGIPENSVYVVVGTELENKISIGDVIDVNVTFPQPKYGRETKYTINLTVAGFVELTDDGYAFITGNVWPGPVYRGYDDILIIDWDSTFMKMWTRVTDGTANLQLFIDVDREELISPYNIDMSVAKLNQISDNIQNSILGKYQNYAWVNNMLSQTLSNHNYNFQNMLFNFVLVSFPIFFVSWYLGSTVSTVSFNIRRREIGLLSTKGLSSGQIQRMFLAEALIIGILGGLLGIIGGLILNQYYAGAVNLSSLFSSKMLNPTVAIAIIIFAVILAIISVFWSARKASRIPAVEALRDYLPEDKQSRKIFPIVALILGGYKMVVFIIGVNIPQLLFQLSFSHGNMFLAAFTAAVIVFDGIMNVVGPLLFFWGSITLLIRDSTIFQTVATKISSAMGELGALAAKNVRRNPKRLAAIAFLIALIIGLSVQTTVQISSREDFVVRTVRNSVGADLTVNVVNASNSQAILNNITQNVAGISNASIEHLFYAQSLTNVYSRLAIKTIEPTKWAASAYYEDSWFTGGPSVSQMLKALKENNSTIILDRSVAKQLDLKLYDEITVVSGTGARPLKIVGFIGPEPPGNVQYGGGLYYSYVPRHLFNMTEGSDFYLAEYPSTKLLFSLKPGVNGTEVANQIRALHLGVRDITSFDEQWQKSVEKDNSDIATDQAILDVQSFGLIFAVISASVGTALVAIVSLKERDREATLMSVRGLSYRQLVWMFLTESLAIMTFAVIFGGIFGVAMAYGGITSANADMSIFNLVTQHLTFSPNALAVIGTYVGLIYATTIGAILIMTSKYVTKLEKMVRAK